MKDRSLKLIAVCALATGALLLVTGCNTVEGIGEDVENLGSGLADTAHDANPEND